LEIPEVSNTGAQIVYTAKQVKEILESFKYVGEFDNTINNSPTFSVLHNLNSEDILINIFSNGSLDLTVGVDIVNSNEVLLSNLSGNIYKIIIKK
jgi:hypothetical protein